MPLGCINKGTATASSQQLAPSEACCIMKPARSTQMAAGASPRRFCCASLLMVALAFSMVTIATDSPLQPREALCHRSLQAQVDAVPLS